MLVNAYMDHVAAQVISRIKDNPEGNILVEKIAQQQLQLHGRHPPQGDGSIPLSAEYTVVLSLPEFTAALAVAFHQGAAVGALGVADAYRDIARELLSAPSQE